MKHWPIAIHCQSWLLLTECVIRAIHIGEWPMVMDDGKPKLSENLLTFWGKQSIGLWWGEPMIKPHVVIKGATFNHPKILPRFRAFFITSHQPFTAVGPGTSACAQTWLQLLVELLEYSAILLIVGYDPARHITWFLSRLTYQPLSIINGWLVALPIPISGSHNFHHATQHHPPALR